MIHPSIKYVLGGLALAALFAFDAEAGKKASELADGGRAGILSFWNLVLGFAMFVGACMIVGGLFGLNKGEKGGGNKTSADHWKGIGIGALAAGIPAIILAIQLQIHDTDEHYQDTKSLIQAASDSSD